MTAIDHLMSRVALPPVDVEKLRLQEQAWPTRLAPECRRHRSDANLLATSTMSEKFQLFAVAIVARLIVR
jgi:hypothetical protein